MVQNIIQSGFAKNPNGGSIGIGLRVPNDLIIKIAAIVKHI